MAKAGIKADVVIVNWNGGDMIVDAVTRLASNTSGSRLIVVDNASTDGSAQSLAAISGLHLIRNTTNAGFAAACNQGAAASDAPYLCFLNPDVLTDPETIAQAAAFLDETRNAKIGICGIQLRETNGHVARSCSRFPTFSSVLLQASGLDRLGPLRRFGASMAEWGHLESRAVDQVIGAFFVIRRGLFDRLGGFDERFFVYYEEVDLAKRAAELGYAAYYLTHLHAVHEGGGTTTRVRAFRGFLVRRGRLLYVEKHFPHWQRFLLTPAVLVLETATRSLHQLLRRSAHGLVDEWGAARLLWQWFLFHRTEPRWLPQPGKR